MRSFAPSAVALLCVLGGKLQAQQSTPTQPFGLRFGTSLADVRAELRATPFTSRFNGWFRLDAVPAPSGRFTSFQLFVSPKSGLCRIVAISPRIESGPEGTEAQRAFSAVRDSLDGEYGAHTLMENVVSNPQSIAADEWMRSILLGERTLRAIWYQDSNQFPSELGGVSLKLAAPSSRAAELILNIDHKDHHRCLDEVIEAERAEREP